MKRRNLKLLAAALLASTLAGCGGDNNGGNADTDSTFTTFVMSVLDNDAGGEPVALNDRDLRFTDRNNPNAYDDLLQ